jgi:mediator of RNA polymerase II transcription subunit 12
MFAEGLLSRIDLCNWLIHQLKTANVAQLVFVLLMSYDYLDQLLATKTMARAVVEICLNRLAEVNKSWA